MLQEYNGSTFGKIYFPHSKCVQRVAFCGLNISALRFEALIHGKLEEVLEKVRVLAFFEICVDIGV